MKRIVWTFGLLSGAVLSVMMLITVPFAHRIGQDRALILGYTTMVAAGLLIYFGIRAYRDRSLGGRIGFWRAVQVGALITVVSGVCYVATWEVMYRTMLPNFMEEYSAQALERAKASGASPQQLEKQRSELARNAELYKNPLVRAAMTFMEPLPVGLLITFVSAAALRRRRERGAPLAEGGAAAIP